MGSHSSVVSLIVVFVLVSPLAGAQARQPAGSRPQANLPPPPISSSQTPKELTDALDGYLTKLTAEERFSGVVLLAKEGQLIFEKAYGFADRANRVPNTTSTRFNLASVNKAFTRLAVEGLVKAGQLRLEGTIGELLPDYPNERAHKATVEQLLDHRGGISDFFGADFSAASPSRFRSNNDYFAFVATRPLDFEPGKERRYCNGCYIVLGEIVSRVTGMTYEQYMEQEVFAPRGMSNTAWLHSDGINANVATGYTRRMPGNEGTLRANTLAHGAAGSAAGGGYSTARDLLAFFKDTAGSRGIGGGAPGTNALIESRGSWLVIVLSNLDPPAASVGVAILRAL